MIFGEKVSPPFKGGVAGIANFEIFTILLSRPGWLIYLSKLNLFSKTFLISFKTI